LHLRPNSSLIAGMGWFLPPKVRQFSIGVPTMARGLVTCIALVVLLFVGSCSQGGGSQQTRVLPAQDQNTPVVAGDTQARRDIAVWSEPNEVNLMPIVPNEPQRPWTKPDKPEYAQTEPSEPQMPRVDTETLTAPHPGPQAEEFSKTDPAAHHGEQGLGQGSPVGSKEEHIGAGQVAPTPTKEEPSSPLDVEPREEPVEGRCGTAEPNQAEPNDIGPAPIEPAGVDANDTEPEVAEPSQAGPNDTEPNAPNVDVAEPNEPNAVGAKAFHDKCAAILKSYVDSRGMVNYRVLRRKRLELKSVLEEFNKLDPNEYESWSREDKIAMWINAYNIQMLDIITRNYPIKPMSRFHKVLWGPQSIRHIEGKWTKYKFLVMDEVFTLSEIEKRFFRGEFDDPRVFFALTRASLSSPPLRNEPYYGYKLNEQLDDQVRRFLSNPLGFKIDREKGKVYLSALFQKIEYGKEFLSKYGTDRKFKGKEPETRAVLNFITHYVPPEVKSFLELGNYTVQFMGYNWTINDGS